MWGRFGQAYRSAISSIRNSRHDNLLVREEHRRLFGSSGKRPSDGVPASQSRKKAKSVAWTHKFVCLSSTSIETTLKTAAAKILHENVGLGEKKLTISNIDFRSSDFHAELIEAFPKLKDGGGFEFLKCLPNKRDLELVSATTPRQLKRLVGNSKVYIRPIQRNLSLDAAEPEAEYEKIHK